MLLFHRFAELAVAFHHAVRGEDQELATTSGRGHGQADRHRGNDRKKRDGLPERFTPKGVRAPCQLLHAWPLERVGPEAESGV
ncbi:hypothetical protein, partial [Streptomyces sp. NPDC060210]|uniref:hypothetical protein n=1 Tax=Streptomyces sp. NPDC060210 TaxID=3347074 RepID=UPI00366130A9